MFVKKNQQVFTNIYLDNSWGSSESKSGPGSRISANKKLLKLLDEFVISHNIKTITDIGCGDFNWMKLFDFEKVDSYTGIDIVSQLIDSNNEKYCSNKINFQFLSVIEDKIPTSDLIICKDVLFHLSYEDALKSIKNIRNSGAKYFISTTFSDFHNIDIKSGKWRPINLLAEPFLLGETYQYWENIEERNDKFSIKSAGVWKF
jgi:2-polyprenyl-3-methyl-5-hydroxy-6-metoxy-1,4-benzoquinol methylase